MGGKVGFEPAPPRFTLESLKKAKTADLGNERPGHPGRRPTLQEIRGRLNIARASRIPLSVAILPLWNYHDSTGDCCSLLAVVGVSTFGFPRVRSQRGGTLGRNPAGKDGRGRTLVWKSRGGDPRGRRVGGRRPRGDTPRGRMVGAGPRGGKRSGRKPRGEHHRPC